MFVKNQKGHGYPTTKDWLKVLGVIPTAPISIPVLIIKKKLKNKDKK